jgi:hypothetical protein
VHVPVAQVHVLVALVAPVAPVHVPVGRVVRARAAPVDPVARVARARVAPVVRRWVVRVPVALVVRAPVVLVAPVVPERVVPVVQAVPVATGRTANVAHRARSRAHAAVATWKSCNRS